MKPRFFPVAMMFAACALFAAQAKPVAQKRSAETKGEERAFAEKLAAAKYKLTPAVREEYLRLAERIAQRELLSKNLVLPRDFLSWVKRDPVVYRSVYGATQDPTGTLLWLRSLEIDLGIETVRKTHTQLALATAMSYGAQGVYGVKDKPQPNLAARPRLKLTVPTTQPNPRINTKGKGRTLDRNDHIVNFFLDHAPIFAPAIGGVKVLPPLVYDKTGIAKPMFDPAGYESKAMRSVLPADVLSSRTLQVEFNTYMRNKGFSMSIDCGDGVIHPGLSESDVIRRSPHSQAIYDAYELFKKAFEEKGLLALPDPATTPAENCAWHIRNAGMTLPPERKWPRFPLTAPWPTLLYLAQHSTPLRQREDVWKQFREKGELHHYGEYTGSIAQDYRLQSARRLSPFPYPYGSIQMALKDGGVCGTMAYIAAESYRSIGIPSCQAAQPGHCALVTMEKSAKGKYYMGVPQGVSGIDTTRPFSTWPYGNGSASKPVIYQMGVAAALNIGDLPELLDAIIAEGILLRMSAKDRAEHGVEVAISVLKTNPYYLPLITAAISGTDEVNEILLLFETVRAIDAEKKAESSSDPYFIIAVAEEAVGRIKKLKMRPEDAEGVIAIQALLGERLAKN